MSLKVWFDTDIGSDIDDAVALAYLLAQPECELLGISTVSGQPVARAQLASAQCQAAGREIPIFPGRAAPLLGPQQQPEAPQAAALARWPHQSDFPRGEAITAMRQTIRAHPGEVMLLATGPLTNIAALFALDEDIPHMLKGLTLMCGMFVARSEEWGLLEWNAKLDPHATAMVYHSPVAVHRSIGLDVTQKVTMPAAEVRRRFQAPLLRPVLDFAEVWFQMRPVITFHDPLAAATLFDEALCRFEQGQVDIELGGPRVAGLTHWRRAADGPHAVALAVDRDRFFEHYFATVG